MSGHEAVRELYKLVTVATNPAEHIRWGYCNECERLAAWTPAGKLLSPCQCDRVHVHIGYPEKPLPWEAARVAEEEGVNG
ncbi:MAG: hypothetical protein Q7O66_15520 [Dehalococcoidia bacterium]|nr:hypothetical protein [Dehalococcoidia bacterium]